MFFGGAMGLYPNRQVIDAAFSIVHDGRQKNVYASGRAPLERSHTAVGPITVEVVEPMKTIRLIVEGAEHGVEADVTFDARSVAVAEERQMRNHGAIQVMDVTRFTQNGTWSGWVAIDGQRIEIDPDGRPRHPRPLVGRPRRSASRPAARRTHGSRRSSGCGRRSTSTTAPPTSRCSTTTRAASSTSTR